jgi:hypothetical protein
MVSLICMLILDKGVLFFFNINTCKMVFPIMSSSDHWGPKFVKTWIYTIQESFFVNLSFLALWFVRRIFLNGHTLFLDFCDYLPFKRTWPLTCTVLNSLFLRMICTNFDWNWPAGSREEFFFKCSINFYSFTIILHWRRGLSFICTILNPLCPRILCAKSG